MKNLFTLTLASIATLTLNASTQTLPGKLQQSTYQIIKKYYPQIEIKIEDSEKYNAYATWSSDNKPKIVITNAVLRNELITTDVLALLICHELGHFYADSPKQRRGNTQKLSWSSAEGQADYYASSICMKKIINDLPKYEVNNDIKSKLSFPSNCKSDHCYRILTASMNLTKMFAKIKHWNYELSLTRKDFSTAYTTIYNHPNPQCRLDTLVMGYLCPSNITIEQGREMYMTCSQPQFRQPQCWLAPTTFEDI